MVINVIIIVVYNIKIYLKTLVHEKPNEILVALKYYFRVEIPSIKLSIKEH